MAENMDGILTTLTKDLDLTRKCLEKYRNMGWSSFRPPSREIELRRALAVYACDLLGIETTPNDAVIDFGNWIAITSRGDVAMMWELLISKIDLPVRAKEKYEKALDNLHAEYAKAGLGLEDEGEEVE